VREGGRGACSVCMPSDMYAMGIPSFILIDDNLPTPYCIDHAFTRCNPKVTQSSFWLYTPSIEEVVAEAGVLHYN